MGGLALLAILAPAGYFAGQELDSEGYTKVIVDAFKRLLQTAQTLDSEQYSAAVADRFKKLLEKVQELDAERHNYIDRLPPLFHAPTRLPQTHKTSRDIGSRTRMSMACWLSWGQGRHNCFRVPINTYFLRGLPYS